MTSLPSYSEALDVALGIVAKVCTVENVELESASGRYAGNDIVADRDLPPYNRSQMDGYAVVANEVTNETTMRVLGHVAAGAAFKEKREINSCVAIATGAQVPDGFDAVVQHELTDNGNENVMFRCDEIKQGKSIHPKGSDAKAGDILVAKHSKLSPQHIGIAASVGVQQIKVISKPKVIVITSGDEVIAPNETPLSYQIRNGNNPMISSSFASMGCEVVEMFHVADDPERTNEVIASALDGSCDLVVTIGGISAGKRDFFPAAFANSGVELAVKGAKIQPGKPVIVGRHESAVVLGLPGNPVSALACSCVFGWPIVRAMLGITTALPWQRASLTTSVKPNPHRLCFRPCQIMNGQVSIPQWQGSGDLAHTASTHGLVQLPSSELELHEGDIVSCLAFPWV